MSIPSTLVRKRFPFPVAESLNRMALVAGTSSGIGLAVGRELLQRGWRVVGVSRRPRQIKNPHYSHLRLDLGETAASIAEIDARMGSILSEPAINRLALVKQGRPGQAIGADRATGPGSVAQVTRFHFLTPSICG